MIRIQKGQDGHMLVQAVGRGHDVMHELSIGAANIIMNTLLDEYKSDPESLREEGRHFGEIVGKIMVDMLSMPDVVQTIHTSHNEKKGENMN